MRRSDASNSSRLLTFTPSLALLALAALAACGGETLTTGRAPDGGTGEETGPGRDGGVPDTGLPPDAPLRVPLYHRPDDSQCATPRPAGSCATPGPNPPNAGFVCSSDADCEDGGADGRCTNSGGGPAGCSCTYDACQTDGDCATGTVCVCHGSGYAYGGNACMPGNCRVDADCGADGYCSPAHGTTGCGYTSGYYCHTPKDACTDDSDCGGALDVCTWSAGDARWECQMGQLCS